MPRPLILGETSPQHRPLVDLSLFLRAIRDRLGLGSSRCHYCGLALVCRWPWESQSPHLRSCAGGRAEAARSTARYLRD